MLNASPTYGAFVASFSGLPTVQFLITASDRKLDGLGTRLVLLVNKNVQTLS